MILGGAILNDFQSQILMQVVGYLKYAVHALNLIQTFALS
jgi:hypothetical protein